MFSGNTLGFSMAKLLLIIIKAQDAEYFPAIPLTPSHQSLTIPGWLQLPTTPPEHNFWNSLKSSIDWMFFNLFGDMYSCVDVATDVELLSPVLGHSQQDCFCWEFTLV